MPPQLSDPDYPHLNKKKIVVLVVVGLIVILLVVLLVVLWSGAGTAQHSLGSILPGHLP
jgi:flagellar basal body-associated protein FliL